MWDLILGDEKGWPSYKKLSYMVICQCEVDEDEEMHLWLNLNIALLKFLNMIGLLHYINAVIIT